jgi:hypothetical protein
MGKYSDLKVMRSEAGYYVGTEYVNDDGFVEPGSRESGYFKTREEAEKELEFWKRLENDNCLADW